MDILKKTYLFGLGAFEMTREKAEHLIDEMVKKGEVKKGERADAVMELMDKVDENVKTFKDRVSAEVEDKMDRMRMARKSDLEALENKVDSLIESIAKLEEKLGEE